jgi:hypothetical protein
MHSLHNRADCPRQPMQLLDIKSALAESARRAIAGPDDGRFIETAWVILIRGVALTYLLAIGLSTSPKPSQ